MSDLEPKEYLRLFKCLLDTATVVVCAFTHNKLLSSYEGSFQKYLEDRKHFFYHQWQGTQSPCCNCPSDECTIQMYCPMESWMFKIFYMETSMEEMSHIVREGESKQKKCIHKYAALNIPMDNLDICPLNYILQTTCILSTQEHSALELIEEKRNTLCHAWSVKCLSTTQLSDIWNDLERAVLGLTNPYLVKIIKNQIKVIKTCDIDMEEITEFTQKISRMNKVLEYRESSSGNEYDNVMVTGNNIGNVPHRDDPALKEVDKTVMIGIHELPAPIKEEQKKCEDSNMSKLGEVKHLIEENMESSSGKDYDNITDWTKHTGHISDRDDQALMEVNKTVNKGTHEIRAPVNEDQRKCEVENMELSSGKEYDNITDWTKHIGNISDRDDQPPREVDKTVNIGTHEIRAPVNEDQRKCKENMELSSGKEYDNITDWTRHIGNISDRDDQPLMKVDKTVNIGTHEIRAPVNEDQRKCEDSNMRKLREVRHLIEDSITELFQSSVPIKDVGLHSERIFNRDYFSRKTMMMRNKQLVMKPIVSFDI
ncbi:uncharacterized protein LOC127723395 isoform X2 [Mytilus californianus]|uniref:uncharacterized protein LOC127723395 isoform X2 n=1 Tax=Mytilus californianus TaxID=6549 RepID=UPI0022471D80|nr:uncharacterized protein LOC127723395 isoform X2 [Mytilus californianus]